MNTAYSNSENEIIRGVFGKTLTPFKRDFGRNRYHVARKFWAIIIRFIITNNKNDSILHPGIHLAIRNHAVLFYDALRFEYECYEFLNGKDRNWINSYRGTKEFQQMVYNSAGLYQSLFKALFNLIEELKGSFSSDTVTYLSLSIKERPQPYLLSPEQVLQVLASDIHVELEETNILWPFRNLKPFELNTLEEIMDSIFYHTILDRIAQQLIEFDDTFAVTFSPFNIVSDEMEAIQTFLGDNDSIYNLDRDQTKYVIETTYRKHNGDPLDAENLGRYLRRYSSGKN